MASRRTSFALRPSYILWSCLVLLIKNSLCLTLALPVTEPTRISSCIKASRYDEKYWLQVATFHARCYSEFPNPPVLALGSEQPHCSTAQCQECISPCGFAWDTVGVCKAHCLNSTPQCQRGCEIFANVVANVTSVGDNALTPGALPSAPATLALSTFDVGVNWVAPNTTTGPIVYAIFAQPKVSFGREDSRNFLVTDARTLTAESTRLCTLYPYGVEPTLQFFFKVVPVNTHGWGVTRNEALESGPIRPVRLSDGVEEFTVNPPAYYSPNGGHKIALNLTWVIPDALANTTGFKISYVEGPCRFSIPAGALTKEMTVPQGTNQTMFYLQNNKDDQYAQCSFQITILPLWNCFSGHAGATSFYYDGCHTLANYPSSLRCVGNLPPTPAFVNLRPEIDEVWETCEGYDLENCGDNCTCIYKAFDYSFTWRRHPNPNATYIVQYGVAKPVLDFFIIHSPQTETTINESITLLNLTYNVRYGMKVIANLSFMDFRETIIQATALTFFAGVTGVETEPPPTLAPTKPSTQGPISGRDDNGLGSGAIVGIVFGALILLVVVLILMLCCYKIKNRKLLDFDDDYECKNITEFDKWEIPPENIIIGETLGEGAFGKVYLGTVKGALLPQPGKAEPIPSKDLSIKAAIKMLQPSADESQSYEFHEEIRLMKEIGQHKNVVSMLGCCTHTEPLCLIVEYMPYGDLLHYLRDRRQKGQGTPYFSSSTTSSNGPAYIYRDSAQIINRNLEDHLLDSPQTTLSSTNSGFDSDYLSAVDSICEVETLKPEDLLGFSWQIATGMEFLAAKGFVHRDLAARNILIGTNKCVKISDFGLTRLVYEEKMYTSKKNRRLPLKWMSVEAIFDQVFTPKSDVWAYGVVLFEIATLGGTPYPTIDNKDLLRLLKSGYRMDKPENCSDEIYEVMLKCWNEDPDERPSFSELRDLFDSMLSEGSSYIDFNFDEGKAYYNVPSFASIESGFSDGEETEDEKNQNVKEGEDQKKEKMFDTAWLEKNAAEKKLHPISRLEESNQRYASPQVMNKHKHPDTILELSGIKTKIEGTRNPGLDAIDINAIDKSSPYKVPFRTTPEGIEI